LISWWGSWGTAGKAVPPKLSHHTRGCRLLQQLLPAHAGRSPRASRKRSRNLRTAAPGRRAGYGAPPSSTPPAWCRW
jgi:hypothetical protein